MAALLAIGHTMPGQQENPQEIIFGWTGIVRVV